MTLREMIDRSNDGVYKSFCPFHPWEQITEVHLYGAWQRDCASCTLIERRMALIGYPVLKVIAR